MKYLIETYSDSAPVAEPGEAVTVRVRDGDVVTTPGAEEADAEHGHVSGYYVVDRDTRQDAVAAAARLPEARSHRVVVRALEPAPDVNGTPASPLPIETERLTLRAFDESDLDALHDLHARPEVARYMYWEPWGRGRAVEALGRRMQSTTLAREGDSVHAAVVRRDTDALIGEVHLEWVSAEHSRGEIGFSFRPDAQGRGYAAEAAVEMLRLGFETFGLRRIIGRCDDANTASARLMERLGMRRESTFVENELVKGVWSGEADFAMLAEEWKTG